MSQPCQPEKPSNVLSFPVVTREMSDAALVATMVGDERAAESLLAAIGGVSRLPLQTPERLAHHGIEERGVALLLAATELARRMAWAEVPEREPLARPTDVARYLFLRYARIDQEVFGALFLDLRNRLVGEVEIYRGTLCRTTVEARHVLTEALLRGAAGIVLFHNHPSGDPSPSAEDYATTRRMHDAAQVLGLKVLEHLVLGTAGRYSALSELAGWRA